MKNKNQIKKFEGNLKTKGEGNHAKFRSKKIA
jgi:hypothetical protein